MPYCLIYWSFFSDPVQGKHKSSKEKMVNNPTGTMLSEDYAEIVEEGDYSVPAGKKLLVCSFNSYHFEKHT